MTTQQDNTITGDDVDRAARELLVLTDLLVQAADGDFSVYDSTVPELAEMLCERANTIRWHQQQEDAAVMAQRALAEHGNGRGNGADTRGALEKHLRKAHDDVQNAKALVDTLTETLQDDGTALSVLMMIEKKLSKAWNHLDYADIARSKQTAGGAA